MEPNQETMPSAIPPVAPIPEIPPHHKTVAGYVLGGMSFIPLIGVPLGIAAIIVGAIKKAKGPIFLGIGGILFSVILYGGLFYFGFVAKTGVYADLRQKLAVQILNTTKGQILIYKSNHSGQLPQSLNDLGRPSAQNPVYSTDPWNHPLIYMPHTDGTFDLKSSGPDGIPNNSDDLVPSQ